MSDSLREVARQTSLLVSRARGWTGSAWDVRVTTGGTRADRLRALIDELALLGGQAGSGAPPGVRPPRVADHALPDQLIVLADDFLAAIAAEPAASPAAGRTGAGRHAAGLTARAHAAVTAARADLDGPGFGFRPH
ncbi:hypothetical protein UG55_103190 [Frankia sp. EI5c]|uniref:hypothetical protein n=1 Tax=Frankia sp. EI5c TaxID=683316 RepID=UPI0007C3CB8C|nr:hypothetical protein [Frankia sp. EI5c]OAA24243.1 hypothetical protein UG55_103190 [Frankia sp. EI5c]